MAPRPKLRLIGQTVVAGQTLERLSFFRSAGMIWGIGIGGAVAFFMSTVPVFKRDVLDKVPVVREYFVDRVPDSDKPF